MSDKFQDHKDRRIREISERRRIFWEKKKKRM